MSGQFVGNNYRSTDSGSSTEDPNKLKALFSQCLSTYMNLVLRSSPPRQHRSGTDSFRNSEEQKLLPESIKTQTPCSCIIWMLTPQQSAKSSFKPSVKCCPHTLHPCSRLKEVDLSSTEVLLRQLLSHVSLITSTLHSRDPSQKLLTRFVTR